MDYYGQCADAGCFAFEDAMTCCSGKPGIEPEAPVRRACCPDPGSCYAGLQKRLPAFNLRYMLEMACISWGELLALG